MAKVWVYNAGVSEWEPLDVGTHSHSEYLTQTEADGLYLTPVVGDGRYAQINHNHDGTYLKPAGVLAGAGIAVTQNGNGTVTIAATAVLKEEVKVSTGSPSTGDPAEDLFVDTGAEGGAFALYPTGQGVVPGPGGGVSDHSALTGLGNDDHLHYHTDARGDARYLKNDGTSLITAVPTDPANVANKKYVDDAIDAKVIVSDDAASGVKPFGTVWIEY